MYLAEIEFIRGSETFRTPFRNLVSKGSNSSYDCSKVVMNLINEKQQFMKAYTVNEVSKLIDIPAGTIRQWEKSLEGILHIPRDDKGSRYYTDFEINSLTNIKSMRDKGLSFDVIKEVLNKSEAVTTIPISSVPVMSQSEAIQTILTLQNTIQSMAERMEGIIAESVRNEVTRLSEGLIEGITKQLPPPRDLIAERQERVTDMITRRKVENQLEEEALHVWLKKPESERLRKLGLFRKEEDRDKRDLFVRSFINEHFEERLRKEYDLND